MLALPFKNAPWLLLLLVAGVALLPRVTGLDAFLSPDEERWRMNTLGFAEGVRTGDVSKLYQQPHPGITTMWVSWPTIHSDSWVVRKLPHAVALSVLTVLTAVLARRLWSPLIGAAVGLFLAVNPSYIAHARILAMDALLAGFTVLSLLAFLLWRKERRARWLVVAGVTAGLALLSKIVGFLLLPFFVGVILWECGRKFLTIRRQAPQRTAGGFLTAREVRRAIGICLASAAATVLVLFPTAVVRPDVLREAAAEFIGGGHFRHPAHALGPWWYPEALLIYMTPLHVVSLLGIPFLIRSGLRKQAGILMLFGAIFFIFLQFSEKKGDRYLLPEYLLLDVMAVLLLTAALQGLHSSRASGHWRYAVLGAATIAALWQIWNLAELHPYEIAYRNPLVRRLALHRPMGWGEGLDLAGEYLNRKPDAEKLLVASYYEGPFSSFFKGEVTSAERLAKETPEEIGADYVVLYRTMIGRDANRWETKVINDFRSRTPEHIIRINGEEYVWVYTIDS